MKKYVFILLIFICQEVFPQQNIIGSIIYDNASGTPLQLVSVSLKNTEGTVIASTTTDQYGFFAFIAIADGTYKIELSASYPWGGGNPTDALLINKFFVKTYTFKDNLMKTAADVTLDKNVNATDALIISKRFTQMITSFKGGDWLFEDNSVVVSGADQFKSFKVICSGDVNGSYFPSYNFTKCGDNLLDIRDGKAYRTVLIGNQCWMAQNMNIGTKIDGVNNQTNNTTIEKYCYNNDEYICSAYGGLYQWDEMMQYVTTEKTQGICPLGWHIPSDAEWTDLTTYLGGENIAGNKMKESGYSHWYGPNEGATNESGFTALPGGVRNYNDGQFLTIGNYGYFWSSSEFDGTYSWYKYLLSSNGDIYRGNYYKTYGFSVRCIKDCPTANAPASGTNIPSQEQIIWKWQAVAGATGYKWSTTNDYTSASDIGTTTSYTQSGLTCATSYTLYVWAYNTCGNSSVTAMTQNTTTCPCPSVYPPHPVTNATTQNQIIWNWQAVTGATAYKYNTTSDYSTAIDNGISTSITQNGLSCNTSYSIYVWAVNSCGDHSNASAMYQNTSECPSTFNCGDNLIDNRDSKSYKTVLIGTQCWMKENINIGTRINGASNQSNDGTIEKYCYNDDENNCNVYGGMYQWDEAMQYVTTEPIKGICPIGWHIPSEGDWGTLMTYVGGLSIAGGKLKETGFDHWASPNLSASNSVGFTALGAGMRAYGDGKFYFLTKRTYMWSSGVMDATFAYVRGPLSDYATITYGSFPKTDGFSVRCIKD